MYSKNLSTAALHSFILLLLFLFLYGHFNYHFNYKYCSCIFIITITTLGEIDFFLGFKIDICYFTFTRCRGDLKNRFNFVFKNKKKKKKKKLILFSSHLFCCYRNWKKTSLKLSFKGSHIMQLYKRIYISFTCVRGERETKYQKIN